MIEGRTIQFEGDSYRVQRLTSANSALVEPFLNGLSEHSTRLFDPHSRDPETIATYVDRNATDADVSFLLVGRSGDSVDYAIAYFFLWEADCDVPVLGIGIGDEYQNHGLGKKLMGLLIEEASHRNKSGIDLTTMPDNHRAFHVYERCGFFYVGDVDNVTGDGRKVTERRMFFRIDKDASPPERQFGPPDSIDTQT